MRDEFEIMRVLRQPPLGKLIVEMGQQRYEKLADIPDPVTRQRLLAAIGELIVFVDGYQSLVDAGLAPPLVIPSGDQVKPLPASISERQAAFLTALEQQREAGLMAEVPAPVIARTGEPASPAGAGPDFVIQINEILKRRIAAEPRLQGRSIQLERDLTNTPRFEVDGRFYQSPKEIDDPLVTELIRAALKEWDNT